MANAERDPLLTTLEQRFTAHPERHRGIAWPQVRQRLLANPQALLALQAMESTGGEPDVIARDAATGELVFCDCAPETPRDRRSLCYDRAARDARQEHQPAGNVVDAAQALGIELLDEVQYRELQQLGEFDRKTSSWLLTPDDVRRRGGALFGDRRYGRVFVYHNGATSYFASRGFRGRCRV